MNIIQAKHVDDYTGKTYTYKLPKGLEIKKGRLLIVENKREREPSIAIAVTDSEEVSENVLNMIMQETTVCSKVLGLYIQTPIMGGIYE